jgi:GrpB-like predicted nucleotidyltransferase (UPF0157 family)
MNSRITIAPYDSTWPLAFADEEARLRAALGKLAMRIDHHGSTAVPGLAAKPILDIQVSVIALQPIEPYRQVLRALGYVHREHVDDSFSPFFHRPRTWPHTHHVHLVLAGGEEERRTLAFRDYLRDHAEEAGKYQQLKCELAERFGGATAVEREEYARAKSAYVEAVIAKAMRNNYPRGWPQT